MVDRPKGWPSRNRRIACALLVVGAALSGAHKARAAGPTCAVITLSKTEAVEPLADYLEAELSRSNDVAVLSRRDLEALFAERSIFLENASPSPEGFKHLGALLRADLLLFLNVRNTGDKKPIVEFVLAETKHGLRLASEHFALQDGMEPTVKSIIARLMDAKDRLSHPVRFVVAVPPFECTTLLFTSGEQGLAFATVARRSVEALPGAIVVDFEHAETIAQELALSDGPANISRVLPYYLIGKYRSTTSETDGGVTVELSFRHGNEVLWQLQSSPMAMADAGRFIIDTLRARLPQTLEQEWPPDSPTDSRHEAELLEQKALSLAAVGDWVEAIDLAQTALLLDPTRIKLHLRIAGWSAEFVRSDGRTICTQISRKPDFLGTRPYAEYLSADEKRSSALLALEHLRQYAARAPMNDDLANTLGKLYSATIVLNYDWEKDECGIREAQRALNQEKVNLALSILNQNASTGSQHGEFVLGKVAGASAGAITEFCPASPEERHDVIQRTLTALGPYKYAYEAQCQSLLVFSINLGGKHVVEFKEAVDRLRLLEDSQSKLTVRIIDAILDMRSPADEALARRTIDQLLKDAYPGEPSDKLPRFGVNVLRDRYLFGLGKSFAPVPSNNLCIDHQGVLTPIVLRGRNGSKPPSHHDLAVWGGWYPCGSGLDILTNEKELYAMRVAGVVESIPRPPGSSKWRIDDVVCDDRYIWIANAGESPSIVLLDRATLKIEAEFAAADGVPRLSQA